MSTHPPCFVCTGPNRARTSARQACVLKDGGGPRPATANCWITLLWKAEEGRTNKWLSTLTVSLCVAYYYQTVGGRLCVCGWIDSSSVHLQCLCNMECDFLCTSITSCFVGGGVNNLESSAFACDEVCSAKTRITPSLCQGCHERALCVNLKIPTFVSVFALPWAFSATPELFWTIPGLLCLCQLCYSRSVRQCCINQVVAKHRTQVTKAFKIKFPRYLMRDDGGAKHFGQR